jgi:hypothetical protein
VNATYGGLLAAAADVVADANLAVGRRRFDSQLDAAQALVDYHGLLDALAGHTWVLLTPEQAEGVRASQGHHPVEVAAIAMAEAIGTLTGTGRPHPALHTQPVTSWARAARCLRAAGDLLATHHNPRHGPRSPDADADVLDDPDVRAGALSRLGHLTITLLDAEDTLALRTLQTGLHPATVRRALPGLTRVADLARTTADLDATGPAAPGGAARSASNAATGLVRLDNLGLVTPPIRTDDPAAELTDRYARMRLHAWTLLENPDYSITTLRDPAVLGVATHAHTAALHGADLTHPDATNRQLKPLLERARAWQALHHTLSELVTAGPGDVVVREDLIAITPILQTLAPITTPPSGTRAAGLDRPLAGALNGAVATMTDIAGWNSLTLDRLARSGHVHVPGRVLTGEQVTDHPDLATARLTGHLTEAPDENRRAATATYQTLRTHPLQPNPPAAEPDPGIDHATDPGIAHATDAGVITRAGYGW